jgi:phosphoadenosine phosphosulfate reductase
MEAAEKLVPRLCERYAGLDGATLLRPMIEREFPGEIAIVSSFGAESAVLLALVAEIDPAVPVLFLDTGKLFAETLRYREELARCLGLSEVRVLRPDPAHVRSADPDGELWSRAPDACCTIRKILPLELGLVGFRVWVTGRKRFQGGQRRALPTIEAARGWIKVNPLATWTQAQVEGEFKARDLPRHPLSLDGYASIGCLPCTARTGQEDNPRACRWPGLGKTECGIHLPFPEQPVS